MAVADPRVTEGVLHVLLHGHVVRPSYGVKLEAWGRMNSVVVEGVVDPFA